MKKTNYLATLCVMFLVVIAMSIVSMRTMTVYADTLSDPAAAAVEETVASDSDLVNTVCHRTVDGNLWITVWDCGELAYHDWVSNGVLAKESGPDAGTYVLERFDTAGSLDEIETVAETAAMDRNTHAFVICMNDGVEYVYGLFFA